MHQKRSLSVPSSMKTPSTPITLSTAARPEEERTADIVVSTKDSDSIVNCSSAGAAAKGAFDLPRCSSSTSNLEVVPIGKHAGKHQSNGGSNTSGQWEEKDINLQSNNNDLSLSCSSCGVGSLAFTDNMGDDMDAVDDGDVDHGSVGSCAAHDIELTATAVLKTRVFGKTEEEEQQLLQLSSPTSAAAAAAGYSPTEKHVNPVASCPPFASLPTLPMSWSAMRKLRLEGDQDDLTTAPPSSGLSSTKKQRRSDGSTHSSNQLHRALSTVATSAGFLSSSLAARPESTVRFPLGETGSGGNTPQIVHYDSSNTYLKDGITSKNTAASPGYWTLTPRLRGVNEVLLTANNSNLFCEALDALHVWNTAVRLDLHHNSAGGTYMVRLALPTIESSADTAPTPAILDAVNSAREVLCVFKPRDEEIGQEANPHGNCESDRAEAFAPGSGSRREVLAYRLDHGHNAGVPPTLEVTSGYHSGCTDRICGSGSCCGRATSGSSEAAGMDMSAPPSYPARSAVRSPAGVSDFSTSAMRAMRAAAGDVKLELNEIRFVGGSAALKDNIFGVSSNAGGGGENRGASRMPQIGSVQVFVPGCQEAADVLPGRFNTEEVHALAIFDIRTLNGDRHGGNVLVQNYRSNRVHCCSSHNDIGCHNSSGSKSEEAPLHLIPIDHSYICPSGYADPDYEWLSWPQAKKPFSPFHLQYIAALDAAADAEVVRCALLAHSSTYRNGNKSSNRAFPSANGGRGSGMDLPDITACTIYREKDVDGAANTALAASRVSCSECVKEQTRGLLLLEGCVHHARNVAQEHSVPLGTSVCAGSKSQCTSSPLLLCESGGNCCGGVNSLTVFSPVLHAHHQQNHSQLQLNEDGDHAKDDEIAGRNNAVCVSTLKEDFDSPHGFSMTLLPEPGSTVPRGRVTGWCDHWSEATAGLNDSCNGAIKEVDEDDPNDNDDDFHGKKHSKHPLTGTETRTFPTSASLSFAICGGVNTVDHCGEVIKTVTYDEGAANAAAEVLWCATRLLQIAALEFHMTAYEIGSLCRRPRVAQASLLEGVIEDARDEFSWEVVPTIFDTLVRQRLTTVTRT